MKAANAIGKLIGTALALPYLFVYLLHRLALDKPRALSSSSESIAWMPGHVGVFTRQAFYRRVLASVGKDVHFGYMTLFSKPEATIGDRAYLGRFCTIGWAQIGPDAMLADGVQVLSGGHQHGSDVAGESANWRDNPQTFTKVTIGAGAWIGAGAIIMADVGERAVVGAGAVVTKPVPAGDRVAGVPARPIGLPTTAAK